MVHQHLILLKQLTQEQHGLQQVSTTRLRKVMTECALSKLFPFPLSSYVATAQRAESWQLGPLWASSEFSGV